MKKYMSCFALACAMLFSTILPVTAEVLFSNPSAGPSAPDARNITTYSYGWYAVYDDFSLSSDSIITSVSFRGWTRPGAGIPTITNWTIYADNGGVPGTGLYNATSVPTISSTVGYLGGSYYTVNDYVFSIDSLAVPDGVYWLALRSPITEVFWEVTTSLTGPMTNNALQYYSGSGVWPPPAFGGDVVFNVNGSSAAVPEPTTMLILGLGLMGLAGVKRRFKN